MKAGYLLQELRFAQVSAWGRRSLSARGVEPCLEAVEEILCALSDRLNDYQRETITELFDRVGSRHEGACLTAADLFIETMEEGGDKEVFEKRLVRGDEMTVWKAWQKTDWRQVHMLFQRITKREAGWFRIGDRLGGLVFQLLDGRKRLPLSDQQWDDLYSGVDLLSERISREVNAFFPCHYRSHLHLACQLVDTFRGLCNALQDPDQGLLALPCWDGNTVTYRGQKATTRRQSNSVIVPILDMLQVSDWPDSVPLPRDIEGGVSLALHHFNGQRVIHLWFRNGQVFWGPALSSN
jgi:hypothetical protein